MVMENISLFNEVTHVISIDIILCVQGCVSLLSITYFSFIIFITTLPTFEIVKKKDNWNASYHHILLILT